MTSYFPTILHYEGWEQNSYSSEDGSLLLKREATEGHQAQWVLFENGKEINRGTHRSTIAQQNNLMLMGVTRATRHLRKVNQDKP